MLDAPEFDPAILENMEPDEAERAVLIKVLNRFPPLLDAVIKMNDDKRRAEQEWERENAQERERAIAQYEKKGGSRRKTKGRTRWQGQGGSCNRKKNRRLLQTGCLRTKSSFTTTKTGRISTGYRICLFESRLCGLFFVQHLDARNAGFDCLHVDHIDYFIANN